MRATTDFILPVFLLTTADITSDDVLRDIEHLKTYISMTTKQTPSADENHVT